MLGFISKKEYFNALDSNFTSGNPNLKDIQDGFIYSLLKDYSGKKIAEMGGGVSRILKRLRDKNECWNIDKLEGRAVGPIGSSPLRNIRLIKAYVGDFSGDIPENYFDVVFSISVIEHNKKEDLENAFRDIYRILKSGGKSFHAIDTFLGDTVESNRHIINNRLKHFLYLIREMGFQLIDENIIDVDNVVFKPSYASCSDFILYDWILKFPHLRKALEMKQCVSIKLGFRKPS